MENYEDDVLMSPDKMEFIAKKYKEELMNKFSLKDVVIYKKTNSLIEDIIGLFKTLKILGSLKFRKLYLKSVEENIVVLSEIYYKYNSKKPNVEFSKVTFYNALRLIIKKLLDLVELSFYIDDEVNLRVYLKLIKETIKYF